MKPVVRVVGLGPGSLDHVTRRTYELLTTSPVVRLRTRVHPSAEHLTDVESYDELYEVASSFDELYQDIVEDLVRLAMSTESGEVVYAVPGSPIVAERTVELLRERSDVTTVIEPAVSVIDLACAVLGRDPMESGLRVVDALGDHDVRGPGPLLILQAYSSEILSGVADRLGDVGTVTVLHHLGLIDEIVATLPVESLATFAADHLTSLWVEGPRDGSVAMGDLIDFARRLRAECPWDQEQTHASLTRYLLEEAYETLDALETLARVEAEGLDDEIATRHVEEELGDLLFQIVFHAELGDEEGRFNLATVADAVRDKLTGRHPHVFGDTSVRGSAEVAERWENIKRDEKGRESVTEGIAWQLPALSLYTKLLTKAALVDAGLETGEASRQRALAALEGLTLLHSSAKEPSASHVEGAWGDVITSLVAMAQYAGVDLEGVLRERARALREAIRMVEEHP